MIDGVPGFAFIGFSPPVLRSSALRRAEVMIRTTQITIDHTVVTSDRTYQQVVEALEARLGQRTNWDQVQRDLQAMNASGQQAAQIIEQHIGTSGFTIFSKMDPGDLLTRSGKPTKAVQYALGNPLLAIQMIEHAPEAALYAPSRLVVYENHEGQAVVAYERFTSQLAQYPHPQIAAVAQQVEDKLEELVAEATGDAQGKAT